MADHRTPRRQQSTYESNGGRKHNPAYIPYVPRHGKASQPGLIARILKKGGSK